MKLKIEKLGQRDEEWSRKHLGYSNTSIGNYGCFLVCLCMQAKYYGYDYDPNSLNNRLKETGGFSNDLIKAQGVLEAFPSWDYERIDCETSAAPIDRVKKRIDEGHPTIIKVDFVPSTAKKETHFCLVIGYTDKDLLINDPWTGEEYFLTGKYPHHNKTYDKPEHAIEGLRIYTDKNFKNSQLDDVKKQVEDLQKALTEKQNQLIQKDQVISETTNTLRSKITEIEEYKKVLEGYAELLNCPADTVSIKGQIKEALGNEEKLNGCLLELKQERENMTQKIETLVKERLMALESEIKTLSRKIITLEDTITDEIKKKERWKSLALLKKESVLLVKLRKWLEKLKEKFSGSHPLS